MRTTTSAPRTWCSTSPCSSRRSRLDNFEWATGYFTKFGLYRVDSSKRLLPRPSAEYYRRIVEANAIPQYLLDLFGP